MDLRLAIRIVKFALSSFFSSLLNSCVSVLRITILSSVKTALDSRKLEKLKKSRDCYVLGNGPSLKNQLESGEVHEGDGDIVCVNMFCLSEYFYKLKPRYYLLCDGQYFNPTIERSKQQVSELIDAFNSVDWEMFLMVPPKESKACRLIKSIQNANVKVIRINHTEVGGFKWFRHLIYKSYLGMPRCQTVINFALTTAINMKYNTIYLYGAEHSWSKDMWVGDDNKVYTGDPHLYENKEKIIALPNDITEEFLNLSRAFATHKLIRTYADSQGVKIINKTKGSFIDAYERK